MLLVIPVYYIFVIFLVITPPEMFGGKPQAWCPFIKFDCDIDVGMWGRCAPNFFRAKL